MRVPSVSQVVVGAGAIVLTGLVAPTSASAATGYARCPANRVCAFTAVNGGGAIGIFAVGDANLAVAPGPSGLNNNIESVWNRTGNTWGFYNSAGYTGGITLVNDGAKGNIEVKYRNITTSLKNVRA